MGLAERGSHSSPSEVYPLNIPVLVFGAPFSANMSSYSLSSGTLMLSTVHFNGPVHVYEVEAIVSWPIVSRGEVVLGVYCHGELVANSTQAVEPITPPVVVLPNGTTQNIAPLNYSTVIISFSLTLPQIRPSCSHSCQTPWLTCLAGRPAFTRLFKPQS